MAIASNEVVTHLTLDEMLERCSDKLPGVLVECIYENLSPELLSRLLEARSYPNESISRELQEALTTNL